MSSEPEVIICYCLKCGLELGSFDNSWEGLGRTYYMPKVTRDLRGLKGVGAIKIANGQAQIGTVIENSALQDLSCAECREVLGMRCDNAPEGHLLKRDQLLLCAKKLSMESQQTKGKAVLAVMKRHELKKPPNDLSSLSQRPSYVLSHTPRPRNASRQSFEKPFVSAVPSPPMLADAGLTLTIREQRKDIDGIDAAMGRLQNDMQDVKFFMEDVRREMTDLRNSRPFAESVIDTLRADFLHVGDKANEMDDIRSQLESLHTRIKDIEKAVRNAEISKPRAATSPASSNDQPELQSPQQSVIRGRGNWLYHARDPTTVESDRTSRRKRRYSEAESDQVGDEVANITKIGQQKRRQQPEIQQDEASDTHSISPTHLSTEEPATPSQPRPESPILGQYHKNDDTDHTQQYDDVQNMEEDTERQIPESPPQEIETEMNTPHYQNNNEKHQNLQDTSQSPANQIPESPQETSPSRPFNISPQVSGGYPFTSHLHLPLIQYQGPYTQLETPNSPQPEILDSTQLEPAQIPYQSPPHPLMIPNSSQSSQAQPFEDIQEQQLPTLTHRSRGRPKGSKNSKPPVTTSSIICPSIEDLSIPVRALRRRTIPILDSSSAVKPLVEEVAGTPSNNMTNLTKYEDGVTVELQEVGEITTTQLEGQGKGKNSALAQEAEEEVISQFINTSERPWGNTRSSRHRSTVDLSDKENESEYLGAAGTTPSVQVQVLVQDIQSTLAKDVEMEDVSQDPNPTKRLRRSTRGSRHRPSVDLDADVISITTPAVNNASSTENDEHTEKQAKQDRRFTGSLKETTSDGIDNHAMIYTERGKRQQRERELEREQERERGREQEKRQRSARRRELERRDELVKEALRLEE
ncbi:hypothetical protein DSL72_002494 [Monilinia vaccinii-corymbosi]|uniref:Uncharacterized protein n=1 Tax=Monilinia vaccinii-corymbosi TaxID=61207 RepID=A0A8A3PCV9_9HELO|nr:hypothetical protein DSL72_002494 [Monilinia vaccinii-corymbosi]